MAELLVMPAKISELARDADRRSICIKVSDRNMHAPARILAVQVLVEEFGPLALACAEDTELEIVLRKKAVTSG